MFRTSVGLPPLFTCERCGLEVDPKSQSCLQMVKGWAKPNKKTIVRLEEESPIFIHEHCLITYAPKQDTLF